MMNMNVLYAIEKKVLAYQYPSDSLISQFRALCKEKGLGYSMNQRISELKQVLEDEVLWCLSLILILQRKKYVKRVFEPSVKESPFEMWTRGYEASLTAVKPLPFSLREECAGYWQRWATS